MANGQLNDAERLWIAGSESIRRTVPDAVWRAWFDAIRPVHLDDTTLMLAVPSAVVRDRLERQYGELIADALSDALGQTFSVQFEVHVLPDTPADLEDLAEGLDLVDPAQGTLLEPGLGGDGAVAETSGAPLNPRFTFDAFVIGSSNRFAHAAALAVAERPARAYNPLFIHGGAGLGKTHLLHGIGNYVRENFPTAYVRYVSTETFMNEFVSAVRTNTQPALRRRYRECDVLLVDDIQFMEGKEGLQEEFFHTFNDLQAAGKQIVLTSDRPPKAIATLEVRLTSRFMSGLTTDVQPPDLETRLAILHKKAESERTEVPHDVCEFIASNVKDNIRELEGALTRVCAYSSLNGEPLTGELAERVLGDMFGADKPRQITPGVIIDATAKMFGFTVDELIGASRRRPLVTARQIGMYVCRELTDYSYPAIAREFGGRDHTTVIHAVEKIGGLMGERRAIFDQVTELIGTIRRGG